MTRLHLFEQLSIGVVWKMPRTCGGLSQEWALIAPVRPTVAAMLNFTTPTLDLNKVPYREDDLAETEGLAAKGRTRQLIRWLRRLRGEWLIQRGSWEPAVESLRESVQMAREVGQEDPLAETLLALAKLQFGQLAEPRQDAEQLGNASWIARLALAELWLAIGDRDQAKKYALAAYQRAWHEGEPFVDRNRLNKSRALLEQLGAEIPKLPPYDPAKDEKLPWEDAVVVAIEVLRAKKAAEAAKEAAKPKPAAAPEKPTGTAR